MDQDDKVILKWVRSAPRDQFSIPFLQGMLNRLVHGFFKYGDAMREDTQADWIKCLEERVKLYKKTGNTEWLIDASNYAMLEFIAPRHKKAHFRATRSDESPGEIILGGKRVERRPDPLACYKGKVGD